MSTISSSSAFPRKISSKDSHDIKPSRSLYQNVNEIEKSIQELHEEDSNLLEMGKKASSSMLVFLELFSVVHSVMSLFLKGFEVSKMKEYINLVAGLYLLVVSMAAFATYKELRRIDILFLLLKRKVLAVQEELGALITYCRGREKNLTHSKFEYTKLIERLKMLDNQIKTMVCISWYWRYDHWRGLAFALILAALYAWYSPYAIETASVFGSNLMARGPSF